MPVNNVIFDLDGTLLDSLSDIADAINHALERNRFSVWDPATIRGFVGAGAENLVIRSLPEKSREKETVARVLGRFSEFYATHWNRSTRPYPGIPELLRDLQRRKMDMAILSNKPVEFTRAMTRHYFPEISFRSVIGQGSGVPQKPDPGGILELMKTHSWRETETAMVGDSAADILAALGAKIMAVGVSWGFRDAAELETAGAHHVVNTSAEILTLMQ